MLYVGALYPRGCYGVDNLLHMKIVHWLIHAMLSVDKATYAAYTHVPPATRRSCYIHDLPVDAVCPYGVLT